MPAGRTMWLYVFWGARFQEGSQACLHRGSVDTRRAERHGQPRHEARAVGPKLRCNASHSMAAQHHAAVLLHGTGAAPVPGRAASHLHRCNVMRTLCAL